MQPARRRLCAALLACTSAPCWAAAPTLAPASGAANGSERRAALVIGNSAYKVGVLKNPVNDAQAVAGSLKGLGFDVVLRENTSLRDLIEAFRQFSMSAKTAGRKRISTANGNGLHQPSVSMSNGFKRNGALKSACSPA